MALPLSEPKFPFLFQALANSSEEQVAVYLSPLEDPASSLPVASRLCPLPPSPGRLCQLLVIYIPEQLLTDSCELGGV